MEATPLELVCFDMAGTTVADDGRVVDAFDRALREVAGRPPTHDELATVRATMGQSKIEVFTQLLGDPDAAQRATHAFEGHYANAVRDHGVEEVRGAAALFGQLRRLGTRVVLTTGFSSVTQSLLIETLGWGDLIDGALCPSPELRGRPFPDMLLAAALHWKITDLACTMSVGDTPMDARSGARARFGHVVGVRTGGFTEDALRAEGATFVVDSVADLADAPVLAPRAPEPTHTERR